MIDEDGIIKRAIIAKKEYKQTEVNEQKDLEELYSSMLIATNDNAQVTVSIQDLKTFIQQQVNEQVGKLSEKVEQLEAAYNNLYLLDQNQTIKLSDILNEKDSQYVVPQNGIIELFLDQNGTDECNLELHGSKYTKKYYANASTNYMVFTDSFIVNKDQVLTVANLQNGFRNYNICFIPFQQ